MMVNAMASMMADITANIICLAATLVAALYDSLVASRYDHTFCYRTQRLSAAQAFCVTCYFKEFPGASWPWEAVGEISELSE